MELYLLIFIVVMSVIVVVQNLLLAKSHRNTNDFIRNDIKNSFSDTENRINEMTAAVRNELVRCLGKESEIDRETLATEIQYLEVISAANKEDKKRLIDICLHRLPGSYKLMCLKWDYFISFINNTNVIVEQRNMIAEIDRCIKEFYNNAPIDIVFKVDGMREELDRISTEFIKTLKNTEYKFMENTLELMEKNLELLKNDSQNASVLEVLEKLDKDVDRDRLNMHEKLLARYQNISKVLSELFANDQNSKENDQDQIKYNADAMKAYRNALEKFNESKGLLQDKDNRVKKIVDLIGTWDNKYLYQPAQTYTASVYMSIFSNLKNNEQFEISGMMINAKKKEL